MRDFTAGRIVNCSCAVQNDRFFRTIDPNLRAPKTRPDNPVSTSSRDGSTSGSYTSLIYLHIPARRNEEDKGISSGRSRRKFRAIIIAHVDSDLRIVSEMCENFRKWNFLSLRVELRLLCQTGNRAWAKRRKSTTKQIHCSL